MSKLKLFNICKTYKAGNTLVQALENISLEFRNSEFVSILGPSGCGKTTFLNIVGGLDRYDSGDLIINDSSTKNFKDKDWDAYRNQSIGFVFQNYNLISHQTVLENVEIAMTLSGVSKKERKERATEALEKVHLGDQLHKKPNQLSGGQMQRVAIARALVNNPDIILADEPTGALDSKTSVQIMDILKEVAQDHLVIMVTHNGEMAESYSTRVIRFLDGEVVSDSNPYHQENKEVVDHNKSKEKRKTSMSLFTAVSLSFKNLLTKKGRTLVTAFAGSIGIIGVALVLAISNGLTTYMNDVQSNALSGFPISISTTEENVDFATAGPPNVIEEANGLPAFPQSTTLNVYNSEAHQETHKNILTPEYLEYVEGMKNELPDAVNSISYVQGVEANILAEGQDGVVKYDTVNKVSDENRIRAALTNKLFWQEIPDNKDFILSLYDVIGENSRLPEAANEVALVVDEYNRIDEKFLEKLGMDPSVSTLDFNNFIGKEFLKVVPSNTYYTENAQGLFTPLASADYASVFEGDQGMKLKITGILRKKDNDTQGYLSPGLAYTKALTDYVLDDGKNSAIAQAQLDSPDRDVILGVPYRTDAEKDARLYALGAKTDPVGINIYPKEFESKEQIKQYLDAYNEGKSKEDQIIYTDLAETVSNIMGTMLNTVTYVLIGFAGISLIVSTIMIGIITYVSVIERTKEIGILRSVGARKKDISRVFKAETLIVGFTAGILGIVIAYVLTIPINSVLEGLVNVKGIANLNPIAATILVLGSMSLTLIAGVIPARMAAKKDPVVALRTE